MAKFRFPLQALLDERSRVEREKQMAVAAVERQRLDLESAVAAKQAEIRSHKEDWRARLDSAEPGGVDMRTVRTQASAALHARARTQRLALQLAGTYQRLEAARRELREAAMRRRAVELLKERRFEEWKQEQRRREGSELDEIGTIRAARMIGGMG